MCAITKQFAENLKGADTEMYTDNSPLSYLDTVKLGAFEQMRVARLADLENLMAMLMLCPAIWWNAQGRMWTFAE